MRHWKTRIWQAFLVALLFSLTAIIVAPVQIQSTNHLEFTFTGGELAKWLLPAFLLCLVGLTSLLAFLHKRSYQVVLSILFVLSLLLWLQGNFLVWDYGALDGRDIDWFGMWRLGVLDGALWIAGLVLAIRYSDWITRNLVTMASSSLILIQIIGIYFGLPSHSNADQYKLDFSEKFVFSRNTNVIVVVVDSFQTDVFQEVIDEYPQLKEVFDGFVYFRNAVSGFRQSFPSVPNILTGTYFDNSRPMWDYVQDAYLSDSSLPKFLKDQGYNSQVYEQRAGLFVDPSVISNTRLNPGFEQSSRDMLYDIDVALFRYLPHFLKPLIYNNQSWLLSRWFPSEVSEWPQSKNESLTDSLQADYVDLSKRPPKLDFSKEDMQRLPNLKVIKMLVDDARVGYEQPVFKYYHLAGIHLPIRMNRDLQYVEPERNRAALKDSAIGVIRLMELALNSFRELGIFDDALILMVADHGVWSKLAEVKIPEHIVQKHGKNSPRDRNSLPERKGTALPLILVKRVGSQGEMLVNDAPVALSDIPRTVVDELGFDADNFPGKSMFRVRENQSRKRLVYYSTFKENPAYSQPYRSTMTEFIVDGFSWLDQSWKKTGKQYPPPEQP